MNQLIRIGNQEITTKEFKGQRVVTFKDIDLIHERPDGTAGRNFRENKIRFIEGEDYFQRNSSEAKSEFDITAPNGLIIITEQGYLMLVKSFTDDLAWDVQRQLVNTYFKVKKPLSAIEQLQLTQQAVLEVKADVVSVNDDLQAFKKDMPILGIEESRITNAVRKKGVHCLGGKQAPAYNDKSIRQKVYSDIYSQLKREFGVDTYKAIKRSQCDSAVAIIERYELPLFLADEIADANAQMFMAI